MLSLVPRIRISRGNAALSIRTSRRWKLMLTDSLATDAWLSCEMRPSRLQRAVISALNRVAVGARTRRTRRLQLGWSLGSSCRGRRQEAPMMFATRLLSITRWPSASSATPERSSNASSPYSPETRRRPSTPLIPRTKPHRLSARPSKSCQIDFEIVTASDRRITLMQ